MAKLGNYANNLLWKALYIYVWHKLIAVVCFMLYQAISLHSIFISVDPLEKQMPFHWFPIEWYWNIRFSLILMMMMMVVMRTVKCKQFLTHSSECEYFATQFKNFIVKCNAKSRWSLSPTHSAGLWWCCCCFFRSIPNERCDCCNFCIQNTFHSFYILCSVAFSLACMCACAPLVNNKMKII